MLPWIDDPALAYEHLHRYAFAARARRGPPGARPRLRRGLRDGAAGRARRAGGRRRRRRAGGRHAAATYRRTELRFATGSADAWRVRRRRLRRRRLLRGDRARRGAGARRRRGAPRARATTASSSARRPSATRTASGPARRTRSTSASSTSSEFREPARHGLPAVVALGAADLTGSLLEPLAPVERARRRRVYVERDGDYWDFRERPEPLYVVAVASGRRPALRRDVRARRPRAAALRPATGARRACRARAARGARRARRGRGAAPGLPAGMERREAEVREQVAVADALRAEMHRGDAERTRRAVTGSNVASSGSRTRSSWRALEAGRARLRRADGTPNARRVARYPPSSELSSKRPSKREPRDEQ